MGGGNPAALQCNVTFCFSLTVTEGGGFVMKCGNSGKQKIISLSGSAVTFCHFYITTRREILKVDLWGESCLAGTFRD